MKIEISSINIHESLKMTQLAIWWYKIFVVLLQPFCKFNAY